MKSIDLIINKVLVFVTIIVLAEMFYAPHPRNIKTMGVFPAINIIGYTFTIAELFICIFIAISFIYVLIKILTIKKFTLGPKEFVPAITVFVLLLIISLIIGVLNSNEGVIPYFLMIIYPMFLYFILLNINISGKIVRGILRLLFSGLAILMIINLITFFRPQFLKTLFFIPEFAFVSWFTLSATLLVVTITFSRLTFFKFNIYWLLLCFLSILSIMVYLPKHVSFALVVSLLILITVGIAKNRIVISFKLITVVLVLIFLFSLTILLFPQHIIDGMIAYIEYRWLNVGRGELEWDLSSGRFDVWTSYLRKAISGYGFSPHGFGHITEVEVYGSERYMGTHNVLVFFTYNLGYLSVICLLWLYFKFLLKGIFTYKNYIYKAELYFKEYESIAIFAFLNGIIAISMVTHIFDELRTAWIFWLLFVFLIIDYQKIKFNSTKDN